MEIPLLFNFLFLHLKSVEQCIDDVIKVSFYFFYVLNCDGLIFDDSGGSIC